MFNIKRFKTRLVCLITATALIASSSVLAGWPAGLGSSADQGESYVAIGSAGQTYMLGTFTGTMVAGSQVLSASGGQDVYLVRLSSGGDIEWARKYGGTGSELVRGIAVDSSDNVYITGEFAGTASFASTQLGSSGGIDVFVAKVNSFGDLLWATHGGSPYDDGVVNIGIVSGNPNVFPTEPDRIFIGGTFRGSANFGGSVINTNNTGNSDFTGSYIARLQGDGTWDWARRISRNNSNTESFDAMTVTRDGRILVAGYDSGTAGSTLFSENFDSTANDTLPTGWSVLYAGQVGSCTMGAWPHNLPAPGDNSKDLFFSGSRSGAGTPAINASASNISQLQLSYTIVEGEDFFSEDTDWGENFYVDYLADDGQWKNVAAYQGGSPRTRANVVIDLPLDALHAGLKIRFNHNRGSGGCWDYWHIDNLSVTTIVKDLYQTALVNTLTDNRADVVIEASSTNDLDDNLHVVDIAYEDGQGDNALTPAVYIVVDHQGGTGVNPPVNYGAGKGSAILKFTNADTGGSAISRSINGGAFKSIAQDIDGNLYLVGDFDTDFSPYAGVTLRNYTATVTRDVFVGKLDPSLNWTWVTGGNGVLGTDDASHLPGIAGGINDDTGSDIVVSNSGQVVISGLFADQAVFGDDEQVLSNGGSDNYAALLDTDGAWFDVQFWIVGDALVPPSGALLDNPGVVLPEILVDGTLVPDAIPRLFYWSQPGPGFDAQLVPVQPVNNVEIRWRVDVNPVVANRAIQIGNSTWPSQRCNPGLKDTCYQIHVAGAPVELEPEDNSYKLFPTGNVLLPDNLASNATVTSNKLTATQPGFAVLVYIRGPVADPGQYPTELEVVRTVAYQNAPDFEVDVPWEVGQTIFDLDHNQPNRTGYVLNENAFYDAIGSAPVYNRSARTGQIIPVNVVNPTRIEDAGKEMVVVWYQGNARNVYWPQKPVQYDVHWPLDPEQIIIASQEGGEVLGQQPLDPLQFQSMKIYRQENIQAPGYNPNEEHAFFAPSTTGTGIDAIFALRSDFGNPVDEIDAESDPYTLVRYFDESTNLWKFRVFQVRATGGGFNEFRFSGIAGTTVSPPYPLRLLAGCSESLVSGQAVSTDPVPAPFFQDYTNQLWSTAAGQGSVFYYYPVQPGFDVADSSVSEGDCIPWMPDLPVNLGGTATPGKPIEVAYDISWPQDAPQLIPGETLLSPKRGLPDIYHQAAVEVVYDEAQQVANAGPADTLAQLIDPLNPRSVELDSLPAEIASELNTDGKEIIIGSADGLQKLPVALRKRLSYDPINNKLTLIGIYDESGAGEPLLLLNVMSFVDRQKLLDLDGDQGVPTTGNSCEVFSGSNCSWDEAVQALFQLSRNPNGIRKIVKNGVLQSVSDNDVLIAWEEFNPSHPTGDGVLKPFSAVGISAALTAGNAQDTGYMTIAFNNDPALAPAPISLNVIRIDCLDVPATPSFLSTYQGQLQIITPDNVFDEQLTLRHSGDFGGNPDVLDFEWYFKPDTDGTPPSVLPDPDNGQMNGWFVFPVDDSRGANEVVIEGANIVTLSDNWFVARYRGLPVCNNTSGWSLYAGQPGATPLEQRAQLAEGWVKRVLGRLNPFEARVQNFASGATNNYVSMLVQLGERWEGDIALNSDPDNLNQIGLIEAYQTVMRRAMSLSVGSTPPVNYGPANSAILLVGSRLVDFYTLLGNEAYSDAQDPTIGIPTTFGGIESLAPTLFNFQNQLGSLLEEELVLLRGRDNSQGPVAASPVYNHLFWNFTNNDGEVAYALSYNITDQNADGIINETDARILYPQGHGDAWGHYLTGLTFYYDLLRHPFYTWGPRPEAITVAGVPIQVDYLDERQFAETAAAKAKAGSDIVNLTYRSAYVEDPAGQWQGYEDIDPDRAWGVTSWARRAGQGAYFDWVTANSIVPVEDPDPTHQGIQKVVRSNVLELDDISAQAASIQQQLDAADQGLNPLGLAKGVVPFDIDPVDLDRYGITHFEQVYQRTETAIDNVISVWNHANQLNRMLRFNQESVDDLTAASIDSETDYRNQLIEIFGYPYDDDIGPGGTYPAGYNGPDVYHYQYVDAPKLTGTAFDINGGGDLEPLMPAEVRTFTGQWKALAGGINFFDFSSNSSDGFDAGNCSSAPFIDGCSLGTPDELAQLSVEYQTVNLPQLGEVFIKPQTWLGERRAVGSLQDISFQLMQERVNFSREVRAYQDLVNSINTQVGRIGSTFRKGQRDLQVLNSNRNTTSTFREVKRGLGILSKGLAFGAKKTEKVSEGAKDCIPRNTIIGFSNGGDILSGLRCAFNATAGTVSTVLGLASKASAIAADLTDDIKDEVFAARGIQTELVNARMAVNSSKKDLDALLREEPAARSQVFQAAQQIEQLEQAYKTELARGQRVMEDLVAFRRGGAAEIQEYRYQDMAFRIFRNDALQKYRAAFDLAARYVYLAASAYDYETNLLGSDSRSGQDFLTDIVRERSIGQILDGQAVPGSRGLADPMARMKLNFDVLKGQMGFNNPQIEGNQFSLRTGLFRVSPDSSGDDDWTDILKENRVDDLWLVPEFR
ncbi:MAG: SBBP repeat-containing protein, partial [bacterium]